MINFAVASCFKIITLNACMTLNLFHVLTIDKQLSFCVHFNHHLIEGFCFSYYTVLLLICFPDRSCEGKTYNVELL